MNSRNVCVPRVCVHSKNMCTFLEHVHYIRVCGGSYEHVCVISNSKFWGVGMTTLMYLYYELVSLDLCLE